MSKELTVPDYLKAMVASGEVVSTVNQMNVANSGIPRISTKGKVFRQRDDSNEVKLGQSIDVVIVGMSPEYGLAHTYYKDGYTPDSNDPPDCSSQDGIKPDYWISKPVSSLCANCPNQSWGSAKSMSGKKAKACKDSKQLYVAMAKDFGGDPKSCKLWGLSVTVNSLKNFSNYGKQLAANGIPSPHFVVTNISMDEDEAVPKLVFSIRGVLNEALGKESNIRNKAKEWDSFSSVEPQRALSQTIPTVPDDEEEPAVKPASSASDLLESW